MMTWKRRWFFNWASCFLLALLAPAHPLLLRPSANAHTDPMLFQSARSDQPLLQEITFSLLVPAISGWLGPLAPS